jgi:hypothetical protein
MQLGGLGMPQEFMVLLAGPQQDISELLIAIERALADLGFRRDRLILHNKEIERDDEYEVQEEEWEIQSLGMESQKLAGWKNAYVEFQGVDFNMGLQANVWNGEFLNCYVTMEWSTFCRLLIDGTEKVFYSALAAIAGACKAVGGFGGVGMPYDPVSPSEILQDFLRDPRNPDYSYDFVILPGQRFAQEEISAIASDEFMVHGQQGFWILVDKQYVDICLKYG